MRRPLDPEELRLWVTVLKTVRPAPGRTLPKLPEPLSPAPTAAAPSAAKPGKTPKTGPAVKAAPPAHASVRAAPSVRPLRHAPDPLEPRRQRRLGRERDPIEARLDLHGLTQFAAEDRLKAFLRQAQASGLRAVLIITGKGVSGDGVIRRRAPEWLADPSLSGVVAGAAWAHRRHGGEGALYVALKRPAAPPAR
jgi:DNA-nicking Smr family endonuclease